MDITFLAIACALLATAAFTDLRSRTVPNAIPLILVGLFPPAAVFAPSVLSGSAGMHSLLAFGLGAIGFASFAIGALGGGDGKLMAAVGLWVGPGDVLLFLLGMGVVGLGLAGIACFPTATSRDWRRGLPYAVAIALPSCLALAHRAWLVME